MGAGVYGLFSTLHGAALNGLLAQLLPAELLAPANGALQTMREGFRLCGPLVGAGLFTVVGGRVVVMVDAATFVVAAGCVALLRLREERPDPPERRLGAELSAGVGALWRADPLRRLVLAGAATMLVLGFLETVVYAVVQALGRPPAFLGVLVTVQGTGAIAGGLTAAWLVRRLGEEALGGLALLALAAGVGLLVSRWLPVVFAGMVLQGVAMPWFGVAIATLTQRSVPVAVIGRVSTATDLLFSAPATLSIGVGAALVGVLDYRLLLAVIAVVSTAAAVPLLRRGSHPAVLAAAPAPAGDP
ncbi:MAG: hypothetical protein ACJ73S_31060 [Mycobacteriales bacterium]